MDQITNISDDNFGGLLEIRFAPVYYFANAATQTFKPGFDWATIAFTSETKEFSERRVDDVNNGYYETAISGIVPQLRSDVTGVLQKHAGKAVITRCEDNNGRLRISGINGRLVFSFQEATGGECADLNGYKVQFSGKQLAPSLFYVPIIIH